MLIFGINISKLKYKDFFEKLISSSTQKIIFTPNPEIILETLKDELFLDDLNKASYLLPDGIGLFIAYQIFQEKNFYLSVFKLPYYFFNIFFRRNYLYKKYGDRICGSDLTKDLINYTNSSGHGVTIIDLYNPNDKNKTESQKVLVKKLSDKYPNTKFHLYIYQENKKDEIIKSINNTNDVFLMSTLGMKKQEKSILEILPNCENIKVGLAIGSSIDYIIGFQKRAPKVFSSIGSEWLYRLITGPKKLNRLKRIYRAIFVFLFHVYKEKYKN